MSLPTDVLRAVRYVYGAAAEVTGVEWPGDWQVARLTVRHAAGRTTLVAKWLRSNAMGWRTDPQQMLAEAEGLRFVAGLAQELVPAVIAANWDPGSGGVVLLEDLAPREPLDAVIRRRGASATEGGRRSFARAMGRLAAVTAGRDRRFPGGAIDPALARRKRLGLLGPPWEEQRHLLERFGVRIPQAAEQEVDKLQGLLAEPGPFLALSNGDLVTNNFMIDVDDPDDHGRLIDFEFVKFDHALAHAAIFFVPGPRWMVVNDPIGDRLEQDFRAALVAGIPEAADDGPYDLGVSAGCIATGFERCGNLTVMDRRPPGHPSRVQRIATVEAAAAQAERRGLWSALSGVLRDLAGRLRHRWADADVDLAVLAPYTPRPE
ncbi:hypothetical protein GCM10011575_04080 [Microlunatus endophyticus]|uniref:Phosphotransferase enzyme family protein n=1 Tax=Microlunatus endophyticus TaxID=1716077 RepID=A0A917S1R7_9ACTN|nr:hypothetical protein [Microlunatus endophyticus]GGL49144.1 hypothetical protein GCM10011575_04080 [Microlunatus endophyticus]